MASHEYRIFGALSLFPSLYCTNEFFAYRKAAWPPNLQMSRLRCSSLACISIYFCRFRHRISALERLQPHVLIPLSCTIKFGVPRIFLLYSFFEGSAYVSMGQLHPGHGSNDRGARRRFLLSLISLDGVSGREYRGLSTGELRCSGRYWREFREPFTTLVQV